MGQLLGSLGVQAQQLPRRQLAQPLSQQQGQQLAGQAQHKAAMTEARGL